MFCHLQYYSHNLLIKLKTMLIKITTTPLERNTVKTQQLHTLIKTAYDCNLFDTKEYFSQLDTLKAVKAGNADTLEAIKTKKQTFKSKCWISC